MKGLLYCILHILYAEDCQDCTTYLRLRYVSPVSLLLTKAALEKQVSALDLTRLDTKRSEFVHLFMCHVQ